MLGTHQEHMAHSRTAPTWGIGESTEVRPLRTLEEDGLCTARCSALWAATKIHFGLIAFDLQSIDCPEGSQNAFVFSL